MGTGQHDEHMYTVFINERGRIINGSRKGWIGPGKLTLAEFRWHSDGDGVERMVSKMV